ELQSEDQIADSPAESGRACVRPLENATIQRPRAAGFFRRDSRRRNAHCRRTADRSAPFCLSRARILWTPTRAHLQIFSTRANEGREIRRLQTEAAPNARLNLLVPRS